MTALTEGRFLEYSRPSVINPPTSLSVFTSVVLLNRNLLTAAGAAEQQQTVLHSPRSNCRFDFYWFVLK